MKRWKALITFPSYYYTFCSSSSLRSFSLLSSLSFSLYAFSYKFRCMFSSVLW